MKSSEGVESDSSRHESEEENDADEQPAAPAARGNDAATVTTSAAAASATTTAACSQSTSPPCWKQGAPSAVVLKEAAGQRQVKRKGTNGTGTVLFNCSHCLYDVITGVAESRSWRLVKSEERAVSVGCNLHWVDDCAINEWFRRVEPWMRINHFPGMNNALGRKSRLAKNLARVARIFPEQYCFLPLTWVLPDDMTDLEKKFDDKGRSKVVYIVKPDNLCQGRGIFLTTELDRIRKAGASLDNAIVVQRYIGRPMLIDGMKFDLRLYLLVASVLAPDSSSVGLVPRYFLFRDGLVRLCTTEYVAPKPDNLNEKCMHLTNYAINKKSKDFVQNDDSEDDGTGSKRSLRWFMNFVAEESGEKEAERLWNKLVGLCVKSLLTVHPSLENEYSGSFPRDLSGGRMGCRSFEVLGIDVMLDAKRRPYLIEVNHLPSFTCDSPLDESIKRRVVEQSLDLVCGSMSGKDRQIYEGLVRERRESGGTGSSTPQTAAATTASGTEAPASGPTVQEEAEAVESASAGVGSSTLLDVDSYKDFVRVFPAPASMPKLNASSQAILARVSEVFRPVQVSRRRTTEPEPPPPPKGAPPKPPRAPAPTGPGVTGTGSSAASNNVSQPPPGPKTHRGTDQARRDAVAAEKSMARRSWSAPAPPRRATSLPSISPEPPSAHSSPAGCTPRNRGAQGNRPGSRQGSLRPERRHRESLPMKCAQIVL
eukprot:gnl/TRDRNA2_/TRDRNA2_43763_c0_seq1.p1 gnl/TRDRNA2_/TRDRNA2_43763_c0~~gnl/TRDRNA2_/TRDRNA2_43763_c0_seq1.p1  ORF type:complete len:709 (-),score=107.56 gnl/TRDRNA2_/TRDRNA2_43763_c0_seq1:112-2238(-)